MPVPEQGQPAPDFELSDQHGQRVRLSSYRGRGAVLLVFFPFAFTPTCTGELCSLRDSGIHTSRGDLELLAVSCDPSPSLRVFAEQQGIDYRLLSDFWPHGAVARDYGAFLEDRGFATRASFLIDGDGILEWSVVTSPAEPRSMDDYFRALGSIGGARSRSL